MSINKLKLKRSAVTGRYPTTASLDLGELAINTFDGKVFLKKDNGTETIVQLADVSGSILSASYAQTASYSDNFNVAGTLTVQTIHVQTITSSTELITGSLTVNGGITGSFSGSLNNLQGTATHIPYFSSSQVLANSAMLQSTNNFSIAINQDAVTSGAPEALYVWQPSSTSYNVISGKGNLNNYLQLNIQNTNQGVSASSDIVATANNGSESTNYIDMGINSENYAQNFVGGPNDAYLYSTGNDLHIGNVTAGRPIQFFAGGSDSDANRKLELNANGQHNMTGSFDVSSSVTASRFVTRGATAAQFVKGDGSLDSTVFVSSSLFSVITGSYNAFSASVLLATASLYAASASINSFSASILNFTASQRVLNGTYATTGSNTFIGTQTVTGSVNVYNGGFNVNGVNVLDTALAYAIALG